MKRLCLGLLVGVATLAGAEPAPSVPGFTAVRTVGGISEYTCDANGLDVLLMEDHSAPVLTFMVTFHVGSRNEVTGTTGATHLLEHMMFKGSTHFNAEQKTALGTVLDRVGGIYNASTWLDRTNYYETLPSDQLALAVELEADRMRGLLLREEDRKPEMTVVRNEFERGENDPAEALDKEVTAAAFVAHPYHHPTIGWRSDIEKVSIDRLRNFYDTFYWPNNATVTVIGDFQPANALELIKKHFGAIPRSPHPIPTVYTEEPAQTGPRRVTVKRPGEVGAVEIAFKVPPALHPDHAPLDVLAAILGTGKSSRFYRALIDSNLAISADAGQGLYHDDSLFTLTALLAPNVTHDKVEHALAREIEELKAHGVTQEDVSRAAGQILASKAYHRDGSSAVADQINECIAVGDWTEYVNSPDKIKAVTAADVLRVAKQYLNVDQSTTGWFVPISEAEQPAGKPTALWRDPSHPAVGRPNCYRDPTGWSVGQAVLPRARRERENSRGEGTPPTANRAVESRGESAAPTGTQALIAPRVHRRSVAGIDVLTLPTSIHEVVTIRGSLSGGDIFNPAENAAIADLTAEMLDQGTMAHDKFALAALLEQVGATLSFETGTHTLRVSGKCLRKDLPLVLGLLAEQLRSPRFDPAEFDKLKQQVIGNRRREMEDTDYRAESALRRALFPVGHPNRPPNDDKYLADVAAATLDQVKAFHAANYGTAAFHLVLVGDIDDAGIDAAVAKDFGGWNAGKRIPDAPKAPPLAAAKREAVEMPGKSSVTFIIGQPSEMRYSDPTYLPLRMATAVLGDGAFSARLMSEVRIHQGLTYGISADLTGDTFCDGYWFIEGTFAPELLDKGARATVEELRKFCAQGITADELKDFKLMLNGNYNVALATTAGLATVVLNAIQRGYGPEWVDEYPRRLQALTLEQVNAAIRDSLHPDKMVTVEAGSLATAAKAPSQ